MITLLRNSKRHHFMQGRQEVWLSFYAQDHPGPIADGIGSLIAFNELRFPPGESTEPHYEHEAEMVAYVYKGALSQEDNAGYSGVIHAGEFQRMSAGAHIRHRETSVSRSDWVHLFRISLQPHHQLGIDSSYEQARFTAGQRRNLLCVVASPDGRRGSLIIHQDSLIYSSILDTGQHIVHELAPGRSVWLHMIYGSAVLDDIVLTQGDGVGILGEPAVSLTVQNSTEILLIDQG